MKLPQTIAVKYTTRVFNKKYKYKIVILSRAAGLFRTNILDIEKISDINEIYLKSCSEDDRKFVFSLIHSFKKMNEYVIRVESPYINFYTNSSDDIEKIAKIDSNKIKYVCFPEPGTENTLEKGVIITKRLDYDFRVTMGPTNKNYSDFLSWAQDKKIKLPKTAQKQLAKDRAWGGYYFYVKDAKLLTMVKMFLGTDIQTVESVIKQ